VGASSVFWVEVLEAPHLGARHPAAVRVKGERVHLAARLTVSTQQCVEQKLDVERPRAQVDVLGQRLFNKDQPGRRA
jgi:hypothetical protein